MLTFHSTHSRMPDICEYDECLLQQLLTDYLPVSLRHARNHALLEPAWNHLRAEHQSNTMAKEEREYQLHTRIRKTRSGFEAVEMIAGNNAGPIYLIHGRADIRLLPPDVL